MWCAGGKTLSRAGYLGYNTVLKWFVDQSWLVAGWLMLQMMLYCCLSYTVIVPTEAEIKKVL